MYNAIHTHTHSHMHTHTHTHTHTHKPVLLRISGSGRYDCQFAMTRCKATHGSHPWNVDLHEMVANRFANAFVFRTLPFMRHMVTYHLRIRAYFMYVFGSGAVPLPNMLQTCEFHRLLHLVICVANMTVILIRTTNPK